MIYEQKQLVRVVSRRRTHIRKKHLVNAAEYLLLKVIFAHLLEYEMIGMIVGSDGIYALAVKKLYL